MLVMFCVFVLGILLLCVSYYTYTRRDFRAVGVLIGSLGLLFVAAGGGLGIPVIFNNTQLGWLSVSQTLPVWRLGFYYPGDSGHPVLYTGLSSACTINTGNGDNGSQVKAPDGCWHAALEGQVDAKIWGAKGNTVNLTGCTTTVSSSNISCPSAPFVNQDVGKVLAVHGSGAAGVSQLGTIISVTNATNIIASFTAATGAAATASVDYGSDDTAAMASAISYIGGRCLHISKGAYWLATQSAPMLLNGACLRGDGPVGNAAPFYNEGSWLLIGNKVSSVFGGMDGISISGLGIYYPEQDGSQVTPVTFPPLFESTQFVNVWLRDNRIINTYDLLKVDASGLGSGLGRVFLDANSIYCINRCFSFLNGAADTLQIGSTNYFGTGAYGNTATAGSAYLDTYTSNSGEFIRIDLGSATYHNVDGLMINGPLIHGYRYGIRLSPSGGTSLLDVSNITGGNWDAVGTVLDVQGNGSVLSTIISGNEIYSINRYSVFAAANVFDFNTTSQQVSPSIIGNHVSYAQGSVLLDAGLGIGDLTFSSNRLENWGNSSTVGSYFGFGTAANTISRLTLSGNTFSCNNFAGSAVYGAFTTAAPITTINGNAFELCTLPLALTNASSSVVVTGNISTNTLGATAYSNFLISGGTVESGNSWDKTTAPALVSGWGTGATIAAGSSDVGGKITVGTTPSSPATLGFAGLHKSANSCVFTDETQGTMLPAQTSTAGAVAIGTKVAGDVVSYGCVMH